MKLILIAAALFITAQSFAANICDYPETSDFFGALKEEGIAPTKINKNHKKWTAREKDMIHLTISLQSYLKGVSKEEALDQFADMYDGKPGSNAGEIDYLTIEGKQYALVHYWPGDNEYGAFYLVKKGATPKLVAEIGDSFISCK